MKTGLNSFIIAAALVAASAIPSRATTVTMNPGGIFDLVLGNVYTDTETFVTPALPVDVSWNFSLATPPLPTITTALTFNADASGNIGIANGLVQWFSPTSVLLGSLSVSDANGVELAAQPQLTLTLNDVADPLGPFYKLEFTGTTLSTDSPDKGGGILNVSVRPVPGPIVGAGLPGLVAACTGLLALARRRRNKSAFV